MRAKLLLSVLALTALAGCATSGHQEVAALRMPWPTRAPTDLVAYAEPRDVYPTVGGDILRGVNIDAQERSRAQAGDTIGEPPARPAPPTERAPVKP